MKVLLTQSVHGATIAELRAALLEHKAIVLDSERGVANVWHTDVTFVVNPPAISTLHSITIPPYGGETLIASSAAAYHSLPEPLRAWADTLWAVHTNVYD